MRGWIAIVATALLLSGCTRGALQGAKTPEQVVQAIFNACLTGEYSTAAGHLVGGREMWKQDPGLVQSIVSGVCSMNVKTYTVDSVEVIGEGAQVRTTGYRSLDKAPGSTGRSLRWSFVKQGGRWLITEVV